MHIVAWGGKKNISGREGKLPARRTEVAELGVYVFIFLLTTFTRNRRQFTENMKYIRVQ